MKLDDLLTKIEGLTWLPWIGNQYESAGMNKMLVIGESHYCKADHMHAIGDPYTTREVIEDMAIAQNHYGTKFFINLPKSLSGRDSIDPEILWNKISFYNFVQRPMLNDGHAIERPNYHDFYSAWSVFHEVISALRPTVCLFAVLEPANQLEDAFPEGDYTLIGPTKEGNVGRCRPRVATLIHANGEKTEIVFIQHPSQYFSWEDWHEYLSSKIPDQLRWLKES